MVIPTSFAVYSGVFAPIPRTLPSLKEFVSGIAVSFLVFDGMYFFWHWAHHKVPFLYRKFHAVHHEVSLKSDFLVDRSWSISCSTTHRSHTWRNTWIWEKWLWVVYLRQLDHGSCVLCIRSRCGSSWSFLFQRALKIIAVTTFLSACPIGRLDYMAALRHTIGIMSRFMEITLRSFHSVTRSLVLNCLWKMRRQEQIK